MRTFNLLKRDFHEGIIKNTRILIIPILFWILCSNMTVKLQYAELYNQASFAEYLLYCFAGIDPMEFSQEFELPILWLSIPILSCYITFDYMRRDISSVGQQTILRVGKRQSWWLCKCAWILCTTVLCFALGLFTVLVYCLIHGVNISMQFSEDITNLLVLSICFPPNDVLTLSKPEIVECVILLPLAILTALNMLGMLLSLMFKSFVSFTIINAYVLFSVYYMNQFFVGCFGMVKNSSLFVQGGFDINNAIIECLLITVISAAAGIFVFKKYNILQEKGDE